MDDFLSVVRVRSRCVNGDFSRIVDRVGLAVTPSDESLDGGNLIGCQIPLGIVGIGNRHGIGQRFVQTVAGDRTDSGFIGGRPHDVVLILADVFEVDSECGCYAGFRCIRCKSCCSEFIFTVRCDRNR